MKLYYGQTKENKDDGNWWRLLSEELGHQKVEKYKEILAKKQAQRDAKLGERKSKKYENGGMKNMNVRGKF